MRLLPPNVIDDLANANRDGSLSGPMWRTWKLHSFEGDLIFTGRFVGRLKDGIPAVLFIGKGSGDYERQRMRGRVDREMNADGRDMSGQIVEHGSRHR